MSHSRPHNLFDIEKEFGANSTSFNSIFEEQKSSSSNQSNKILIPSRVYVPKSEAFPSPQSQPEHPEEDIWGSVKEFPKFTEKEIKEVSQPKQSAFIQEQTIKIPVNPYKAQVLKEENKDEWNRPRATRSFRARGSRIRQDTSSKNIGDIWAEESRTKEEPQKEQIEKQEKDVVSEWPNFVKEPVSALEEFNIKTFKTQKCLNGEKCKGCFKYHYEGERRRDIEKFRYYPVSCPRGNLCHLGDRCGKTHNFWELYYHPQIYKSEVCQRMCKFKNCVFGNLCNELHYTENSVVIRRHYCKGCGAENVGFLRIKCGHSFCSKCIEGDACKKCMKVGEYIEIKD